MAASAAGLVVTAAGRGPGMAHLTFADGALPETDKSAPGVSVNTATGDVCALMRPTGTHFGYVDFTALWSRFVLRAGRHADSESADSEDRVFVKSQLHNQEASTHSTIVLCVRDEEAGCTGVVASYVVKKHTQAKQVRAAFDAMAVAVRASLPAAPSEDISGGIADEEVSGPEGGTLSVTLAQYTHSPMRNTFPWALHGMQLRPVAGGISSVAARPHGTGDVDCGGEAAVEPARRSAEDAWAMEWIALFVHHSSVLLSRRGMLRGQGRRT